MSRSARHRTTHSCAKCNITFSRCDFKHWTDNQVGSYLDGDDPSKPESWRPLPDEPGIDRFATE
jgi:hypothetical protein